MKSSKTWSWIQIVGLCSVMCALGTACGSSEDAADSGGNAGVGSNAGGTTGGGTGGNSGGTSGANVGGTGGAGGTGGLMLPRLTCTEALPTTAITCGGTACAIPEVGPFGDLCQRPCCASSDGAEACGTKSVAEGMLTECTAPPQPDERCPDYDFMGSTLEGCCTADNECGIVSTLRNACVTESMIVTTLPAVPPACDDADAGTE